MDKTALNTHLVTTRLKRCFYNLKSAVDKMCGKVLVRLPMKGMISFILLLVRHVFGGDKFLEVFRQVRDWHRKNARGAGWDGLRGGCGFRSVRGGSGQDFANSSWAGLNFGGAGRM